MTVGSPLVYVCVGVLPSVGSLAFLGRRERCPPGSLGMGVGELGQAEQTGPGLLVLVLVCKLSEYCKKKVLLVLRFL